MATKAKSEATKTKSLSSARATTPKPMRKVLTGKTSPPDREPTAEDSKSGPAQSMANTRKDKANSHLIKAMRAGYWDKA